MNEEDKQLLGVVLSDSGFSGYLTISDIIPILKHLYKSFDQTFFLRMVNQFELPKNKKIKDTISSVYWLLSLTIYLGYSLVSNDWGHSWIIWPIAGVLFAIVAVIINILFED